MHFFKQTKYNNLFLVKNIYFTNLHVFSLCFILFYFLFSVQMMQLMLFVSFSFRSLSLSHTLFSCRCIINLRFVVVIYLNICVANNTPRSKGKTICAFSILVVAC